MLELSIPAAAAPCLLGAIAEISEHPEDARVARLLRFVADELGVGLELDPQPTPVQLGAAIPDTGRLAAVQRLLLAAMLVPPLSTARFERLCEYASALGCADEPALGDLRHHLAGRHRRLTTGLMRRFPPTDRIRDAWRKGSFGDRWRVIKAMLRLPDAATASRYRALAELPEGTLGRAFFEHCRRYGFPLPGERRGLPEPMIFHDMGHCLVGATVEIDDEIRVGGFEAGCMGERGFSMLEFALLLFNLGAKLPTDAAPAVGAVNVDILLDSYADGRRSSLDVLAWDPWADVNEQIAELRRRYRIPDLAGADRPEVRAG
jgi:hypothetical protein